MNGLYAAGLYFGLIFALYSTRASGFKNQAHMDSWWRIAQRKAAASTTGSKTAVYAEQRQKAARQFAAQDPRVKEALAGKAGEAYLKKPWLR